MRASSRGCRAAREPGLGEIWRRSSSSLGGGRPERADQSVTKKLKLRAERKGDASGKPLGC
jgi:hypothetical protein